MGQDLSVVLVAQCNYRSYLHMAILSFPADKTCANLMVEQVRTCSEFSTYTPTAMAVEQNTVTVKTKKKVDDQVDEDVNDDVNEDEENEEEEPTEQGESFTAITDQKELDRIIQDRVRRAERSAAKKLRSEIEQEVKDEAKAEASRLQDEAKGEYKKLYDESQAEIKRLKDEAEAAQLQTLKVSLLESAELPASVAKRIFGTTEEEIKADIEEFLKDSPAVKKAPKESGTTSPGRKKPKENKDDAGRDFNSPSTWGLPALSNKK